MQLLKLLRRLLSLRLSHKLPPRIGGAALTRLKPHIDFQPRWWASLQLRRLFWFSGKWVPSAPDIIKGFILTCCQSQKLSNHQQRPKAFHERDIDRHQTEQLGLISAFICGEKKQQPPPLPVAPKALKECLQSKSLIPKDKLVLLSYLWEPSGSNFVQRAVSWALTSGLVTCQKNSTNPKVM